MARATIASLSEPERRLVAETERDHLRALDEDALIELHARVRRARDKVVQAHRREVAAAVTARGARGKASAAPRRSEGKAEIFETALARVSTSLAAAARASAAALRAERLAAAAPEDKVAARAPRTPRQAATPPAPKRSAARTPVQRKTVAAQRADGARQQAKRAAR